MLDQLGKSLKVFSKLGHFFGSLLSELVHLLSGGSQLLAKFSNFFGSQILLHHDVLDTAGVLVKFRNELLVNLRINVLVNELAGLVRSLFVFLRVSPLGVLT